MWQKGRRVHRHWYLAAGSPVVCWTHINLPFLFSHIILLVHLVIACTSRSGVHAWPCTHYMLICTCMCMYELSLLQNISSSVACPSLMECSHVDDPMPLNMIVITSTLNVFQCWLIEQHQYQISIVMCRHQRGLLQLTESCYYYLPACKND